MSEVDQQPRRCPDCGAELQRFTSKLHCPACNKDVALTSNQQMWEEAQQAFSRWHEGQLFDTSDKSNSWRSGYVSALKDAARSAPEPQPAASNQIVLNRAMQELTNAARIYPETAFGANAKALLDEIERLCKDRDNLRDLLTSKGGMPSACSSDMSQPAASNLITRLRAHTESLGVEGHAYNCKAVDVNDDGHHYYDPEEGCSCGWAELSANPDFADETPAPQDAKDAAKWRALRNCARMTAMGCAGLGPDKVTEDYAHLTLNFWTGGTYDSPGEPYAREWLDKFVAKALRVQPAQETTPPHPGPSIEKAFARSPRRVTEKASEPLTEEEQSQMLHRVGQLLGIHKAWDWWQTPNDLLGGVRPWVMALSGATRARKLYRFIEDAFGDAPPEPAPPPAPPCAPEIYEQCELAAYPTALRCVLSKGHKGRCIPPDEPVQNGTTDSEKP